MPRVQPCARRFRIRVELRELFHDVLQVNEQVLLVRPRIGSAVVPSGNRLRRRSQHVGDVDRAYRRPCPQQLQLLRHRVPFRCYICHPLPPIRFAPHRAQFNRAPSGAGASASTKRRGHAPRIRPARPGGARDPSCCRSFASPGAVPHRTTGTRRIRPRPSPDGASPPESAAPGDARRVGEPLDFTRPLDQAVAHGIVQHVSHALRAARFFPAVVDVTVDIELDVCQSCLSAPSTTTGLISQWERGEKRPRGASLKLLTLVAKNGLSAVA